MNHPSRPRRPIALSLAAACVALSLVLIGCGSSGGGTATTTREAAGTCPSTTTRCVLVSFTNDLAQTVEVRADGKALGPASLALAPGGWGVIRGWSSGSVTRWDIEGRLSQMNEPTHSAYFRATNPPVGWPCLAVAATAGDLRSDTCVGASLPGSSSHQTMTTDVGWATVVYQRELNTTHFVQFVARIRPT